MPCTIGYDFGTESGRALLVDTSTGAELASAVLPYRHGVIEHALPDGTPLGPDWVLQWPGDWLEVIELTTPRLLAESGVAPADIVGIGIDCTACTPLPVDSAGVPLCEYGHWRSTPHAWAKLWKHHAAQDWAEQLESIAADSPWLEQCGGKVSSEWLWPKLAQIASEAPDVFAASHTFVEATDWIGWQLTGTLARSVCCAGYKGNWDDQRGWPDRDHIVGLHPALADFWDSLPAPMPLGSRLGSLTAAMAERCGLNPGTAVAVGLIDAHAAIPACGAGGDGILVTIMGTSGCDLLCGSSKRTIPGLMSVVKDGMLPGSFGYEAGQACFGDHFAWLERFLGEGYPGHAELERAAAAIAPAGTGLLALDWWNGNRSLLNDTSLSGVLLGMRLHTTPAEVYRALIEGLACGKRMIIEALETHGVPVERIIASGGIAEKNKLLLQIFADITGKRIEVARSSQACALGAAIHGAVAAGIHADFATAAAAMGGTRAETYMPDPRTREAYDELFACYRTAHDQLGREPMLLRRLRALATQTSE